MLACVFCTLHLATRHAARTLGRRAVDAEEEAPRLGWQARQDAAAVAAGLTPDAGASARPASGGGGGGVNLDLDEGLEGATAASAAATRGLCWRHAGCWLSRVTLPAGRFHGGGREGLAGETLGVVDRILG